MPLDTLIADLPPELAARLLDIRQDVRTATRRYQRADGVTITPRYELHVRMDAPGTVQFILEHWKPHYTRRVLAEFSGAAYTALAGRVQAAHSSWEAFLEQVVNLG